MRTTQQDREIRTRLKPLAKRRGHSKAKTKMCSGELAGYGFLKSTFEPVRFFMPELKSPNVATKDFFQSIAYFAKLHGWKFKKDNSLPFPENILHVFNDAKEFMDKSRKPLELILTKNDCGRLCVATVERVYTGHSLYYLPIQPIEKLLEDEASKPLADLLITTMVYLYKKVGVSHYRGEDSFIWGCYCTIKEWVIDAEDEEPEYKDEYLKIIEAARTFGDKFLNDYLRRLDESDFFSCVNSFIPITLAAVEVFEIVKQFADLCKEYPTGSLTQSLPDDCFIETDEDNIIEVAQYVSFIYEVKSDLYNSMEEHIAAILQERSEIKEPVGFQIFDQPHDKECHGLEFEKRLFKCLEDLCCALINLV